MDRIANFVRLSRFLYCIDMSKKDLADVLVKLSGFGFVIGGICSASTSLIGMYTTGLMHPATFGLEPYSFGIFVTPAFSILFGSYLVRRSAEITDWLFRDDKR